MSRNRIAIYAAIVIAAGSITLIWNRSPGTATQTPTTPATPAPIPTIDAPLPTPQPVTAPSTNTSNPRRTTSTPLSTSTSTMPMSTGAPADIPAPSATATPALARGTTTTVELGDEGEFTGDEPESVANAFITTAWTDCWNCDPDARQAELARIATPDVAAQWPELGPEDVARYLVRTVEFAPTTQPSPNRADGGIVVETDIVVTDQSDEGTTLRRLHVTITVHDSAVTAVESSEI